MKGLIRLINAFAGFIILHLFFHSVVNVYLIYKENYDTSGMTMLQFRESLVRSLLFGALKKKVYYRTPKKGSENLSKLPNGSKVSKIG